MNTSLHNYQQHLHTIPCDLQRLSYLLRNNSNRLQTIHRHNRPYIRSLPDKYHTLRLIIFALTRHIYLQNTPNNAFRINTLKSIVFQSMLGELTNHKGLVLEELHKSVAIKLQQLQNSASQQNILNCFNSAPFFDQVLLGSFRERFNLSGKQQINNNKWNDLMQTFQIQILHKHPDTHNKRHRQYLLVQKTQQHLLVPSLSQDSLNLVDAMSIASSPSAKLSHYKLQTISVQNSTGPLESNKENVNNMNVYPAVQCFSIHTEPIMIKMPNKKKSFWSMLCCGD